MIVHRMPQKVEVSRGRWEANPDWLAARRGHVTSSMAGKFIDDDGKLRLPRTKADQAAGKYAESVYTAIAEIASERISGYDVDVPSSFEMSYGVEHEAQAMRSLSFLTGVAFESIGGVEEGMLFASTDGVGFEAGAIVAVGEVKIPMPKTHAAYVLYPERLDAKYGAQVRAEMAISGAGVGYLFSWAPEMRHVLLTYKRDDTTAAMRDSLLKMAGMVEAAVETIQRKA